MKKLLVLISFLFVTVCYAAPPPEPVPIAADEVALVADQLQVVDVTVYEFEAREVAFVYMGDSYTLTGTVVNPNDGAIIKKAAKLPDVLNTTNLTALNKPFALLKDDEGVYNTKAFLNDRQHSNYGYPFSAN